MASSPFLLFVYGTLLAEARHRMGDLLRAHGHAVGPGHIQARLYLITEEDAEGVNTYPGAVPSAFAKDRVHGLLYAVDAPEKVLPVFDDFEACTPRWPEPYEFLRRPVDVVVPDGAPVRAESYLYTWDTSRATLIPSGRFAQPAPDVR